MTCMVALVLVIVVFGAEFLWDRLTMPRDDEL